MTFAFTAAMPVIWRRGIAGEHGGQLLAAGQVPGRLQQGRVPFGREVLHGCPGVIIGEGRGKRTPAAVVSEMMSLRMMASPGNGVRGTGLGLRRSGRRGGRLDSTAGQRSRWLGGRDVGGDGLGDGQGAAAIMPKAMAPAAAVEMTSCRMVSCCIH